MKAPITRRVPIKNRKYPGWPIGGIGGDVEGSARNLPTMPVAAVDLWVACDSVKDNARLFAALCRVRARAGRNAVEVAGEISRGPVHAAVEFFDPTRNWHRRPGLRLKRLAGDPKSSWP